MKKFFVMVCCVLLLGTLAACSADSPSTDNVGAVDAQEVSQEILEALGMSAEEFAAMPEEQQQALINEIGMVLDARKEQENAKPQVSQEDLIASGNYVVVLGDEMNSITLYYENGVLVKIVQSFRKSTDDDVWYSEYTGEALEEYSFNFIDWDNASLQDILDAMADYGDFDQYQIRSAD